MTFARAELKGFDSGTCTATLLLSGSYTVYLEEVPVARNIAAAEMVSGRRVAVAFFDDYNPREAVVVAVYTP